MEGIVIEWIQTEQFANGTAETIDGDWYRIKGEHVQADSIGRSYLVIGERVAFEEGTSRSTKSGRPMRMAIKVKPFRKAVNIDPRTHRELVRVVNDFWFIRTLGGLLTAPKITDVRMQPGAIFECGVEHLPGFSAWRATNPRFVAASEAEVDWSKYKSPEAA